MRITFALSTLLLSSLLFMSCNTMKKSTKTDKATTVKLTDTYWKLVELNNKPIPQKLNKVPFIQFDEKENRVFGTNGCNTFFGDIELKKNNQIDFGAIAGTLMACEHSDIEANMNLLMDENAQYTISGDTLYLRNAKTNISARFLAIENADLNGKWTLTSLSTTQAALDQIFLENKPHIEFDMAAKKVSGNGGCNQINAQVTTAGNKLSFGPIAASRMACPGEGESIFLKAMESINRFNISKDQKTLTLFKGDLLIMKFERTN